MWRSWASPRAEVRVARSLARIGRAGEARATVARLLAVAGEAEPDCRWVAEARALEAALARRQQPAEHPLPRRAPAVPGKGPG